MKYIFIILLGIVSSSSLVAKIIPQTATLKNGLRIIVLKNPLLKSVYIYTKYNIGTADDPLHLVGLSHMLEHMMFKGSSKYPGGTINSVLTACGGESNAHTSFDETIYTIAVPAQYLDLALDIEADRMENLDIKDEDFLPEQKVVLEERQMRMGNHPFKASAEVVQRATYTAHPYGIFPIGYEAHIKAYTTKDLIAHYKMWYVPNNATIIVVGPYTLEEILPKIEEKFGNISAQELSEHQRIPEPDREGITTTVEQENPRAKNIYISISYRVPTFIKNPEAFLTMSLLEETLTGSDSRMLYKKMVKEKKLALGVSASYNYGRDDMDFTFGLTLAPNMDIEKAEAFLFEELSKLLKNGLVKKDFDDAKQEDKNADEFAMDGEGFLLNIANFILEGFPVEAISDYDHLLETVTIEKAHAMLKLILAKSPVVIARNYPKGKMPKRNYQKVMRQ